MIEAPSALLIRLPLPRARLSDQLIEDIRLFAVTWAAGFVFLLAFLN